MTNQNGEKVRLSWWDRAQQLGQIAALIAFLWMTDARIQAVSDKIEAKVDRIEEKFERQWNMVVEIILENRSGNHKHEGIDE